MDNFNPDTASIEELIEAVKAKVAQIESIIGSEHCFYFHLCSVAMVSSEGYFVKVGYETSNGRSVVVRGMDVCEDTLRDTLKSAWLKYDDISRHAYDVLLNMSRFGLSMLFCDNVLQVVHGKGIFYLDPAVFTIKSKDKTLTEKLLAVEKWLDKQVRTE